MLFNVFNPELLDTYIINNNDQTQQSYSMLFIHLG